MDIQSVVLSNGERTKALIEALPYIQRFCSKIVVVKYGGSMNDSRLLDSVIRDIILLRLVGISVVLVHGGGPEIDDMLRKLGKQPKFINGLRCTDRETMDVVQGVLAGKINKDIVAKIQCMGACAVGLCGADTGLFNAKKTSEDLGFVGEITDVNSSIVLNHVELGWIPVIAPIAFDENTATSYNINADIAAAKLAVSLGAEKLILLTNTRGVLLDPSDESTLIRTIKISQVQNLLNTTITGGMIPKLDCCIQAILGGVRQVHILDGRLAHSILLEIFTDEGSGTMIVGD